jgi:transposase
MPAIPVTVGLDLGDRKSLYCVLAPSGEVAQRGVVTSNLDAMRQSFRRLRERHEATRVVMEVGSNSPWVSRLLEEMGFEVFVANPRRVQLIAKSNNKTDRKDAELLARLGRADPQLLSPIQHRGPGVQTDLALLRSRAALVESRTQLINHVRGSVKPWGMRLPSCSADCFHDKVREQLPDEVAETLLPVLDQIGQLTKSIRSYEKRIDKLCQGYPETSLLRQVKGVGPITALTYVLTIESPDRIHKTRNVGAYLGLVPRKNQSGKGDPELHITKAGDENLRCLLVNCAHYILGPFGEDSDLRRLGERIAAQGGKVAKRRAVVAVARKLAVLLLRLWQTGEVFDPLRNTHAREALLASTESDRTCSERPVASLPAHA